MESFEGRSTAAVVTLDQGEANAQMLVPLANRGNDYLYWRLPFALPLKVRSALRLCSRHDIPGSSLSALHSIEHQPKQAAECCHLLPAASSLPPQSTWPSGTAAAAWRISTKLAFRQSMDSIFSWLDVGVIK